MPIIRAARLSKCFRIYKTPSDHLKELFSFERRSHHEKFWAVRDVDFEVERGCCLGIIGENGSGKSTLLRMIAGVIRPTSGTIVVNGRISALLELGAGFNPEFTGRENIFLNASILGFTDKQTRDRIPGIEQFAEIGEFVDRPVKTYSSGMFVRLAFAIAIHMEPDLLIVDEALSVGDAFFQQRCIRRIQQLKQQGVTIVFVSHDLQAVRTLADRTIWMEHGNAKLDGTTDAVADKYMAAVAVRGRSDGMQDVLRPEPSAHSKDLGISEEALSRIPCLVTTIPNVDNRFGNTHATILGVGVYGQDGEPVSSVGQGDLICVRISVEFRNEVHQPNVGLIIRNRLGQDVAGTNLHFEGLRPGPSKPGDRVSFDFVMDLPLLEAGFYHFTAAVADGSIDQYETCDWIDNAFVLEITKRTITYGAMRIPTRVRAVLVPDSFQLFKP